MKGGDVCGHTGGGVGLKVAAGRGGRTAKKKKNELDCFLAASLSLLLTQAEPVKGL
jgi:hypothetical protein